ncbi:MAG TPA: serine/threonine-protein kinase, partial [Polyangiaceae bacterium]
MGERLGRYEVLRRLASGGMADVMLARAEGETIEGFARHVVLKRIKQEHAKDARFVQMFLDEARLAASLHHQHIGQVFDVGESGGQYFLAMEYLHGEDVRRILSVIAKKKTHVPLQHALAIASACAAGLHVAHEHKIVHRDVSPSNIIVGYDGSVKLVDFGIARAGQAAGKLAYMSPEQLKGETVDRRSDVWSLGVVLYELVTTTRLFKGDGDDASVMDQVIGGKIPLPRIRRPELTNELQTI